MMISSVNEKTNTFLRGEVKHNVCYRFCHRMYNWKLPHVNSPRNVLWQHNIFKEVMVRTVWSIKSRRSAVFLKLKLCENKWKGTLVKIPSIFSNVFVWATRRRAMERSWHLHSNYPIIAVGLYLPHSCTYQNWRGLIENRISRHVWLRSYLRWSHRLPNNKLIFIYCRIKAYFDS